MKEDEIEDMIDPYLGNAISAIQEVFSSIDNKDITISQRDEVEEYIKSKLREEL